MRQIALDTETTGLSPKAGHRITEIGCVEIIERKITGRTYQTYLNPEREIDARAAEITGLTYNFLKDKPKIAEIIDDFLEFIDGAELIIHNAPFDLGFINNEIMLLNHRYGPLDDKLDILDTLVLAKEMHPGARNNLDALCKRYGVDNSHRDYHGALLDSEILADVYLRMTRGQTTMDLSNANKSSSNQKNVGSYNLSEFDLKILQALPEELVEHEKILEILKKNG